jgi:hypothetical protein
MATTGIPKTPKLSRRLFQHDENLPVAVTADEKACEKDAFYTIVSRVVSQAVPSTDLNIINEDLKQYFTNLGIENENGFHLVKEVDFPARNTSKSNYIWNNIVFRKALAAVAEASVNYKLLPNTDYRLLLQQFRNKSNVSPVPPTTVTTSTQKYKLDSAAKVELKTFTG